MTIRTRKYRKSKCTSRMCRRHLSTHQNLSRPVLSVSLVLGRCHIVFVLGSSCVCEYFLLLFRKKLPQEGTPEMMGARTCGSSIVSLVPRILLVFLIPTGLFFPWRFCSVLACLWCAGPVKNASWLQYVSYVPSFPPFIAFLPVFLSQVPLMRTCTPLSRRSESRQGRYVRPYVTCKYPSVHDTMSFYWYFPVQYVQVHVVTTESTLVRICAYSRISSCIL